MSRSVGGHICDVCRESYKTGVVCARANGLTITYCHSCLDTALPTWDGYTWDGEYYRESASISVEEEQAAKRQMFVEAHIVLTCKEW